MLKYNYSLWFGKTKYLKINFSHLLNIWSASILLIYFWATEYSVSWQRKGYTCLEASVLRIAQNILETNLRVTTVTLCWRHVAFKVIIGAAHLKAVHLYLKTGVKIVYPYGKLSHFQKLTISQFIVNSPVYFWPYRLFRNT